jgi:hypothetical protein
MKKEILMTKKTNKNSNKLNTLLSIDSAYPASAIILHIRSNVSIIHIGSLDSFDIIEGGKEAARKMLDYLETGNEDSLKFAIDIYDSIIPNENFGGEYTALQWVSRLFLAPKKERNYFLSHPMVASWFDLLAKDDFANLRFYLKRKYHFIENEKDDHEAKVKLRFLEDFILFNNPDRMRWDKTSENIQSLNLREGDKFGSLILLTSCPLCRWNLARGNEHGMEILEIIDLLAKILR